MSGTNHKDLFIALCRPFVPPELKAKEIKDKDGKVVRRESYITARTVMNRLDNVVGPENWRDEYFETRDGLKCRLSLRIGDEWLSKEDGGSGAGMADRDDDEKSAYSSAFKRAGVKWGVGRHLYRDGTPDFASGSSPQSEAELDPPGTAAALHSAEPGGNGQHGDAEPPPKSGKALFARLKDLEKQYSTSLLKDVTAEGKRAGWSNRIVEWTADQVAEAWPHILASLSRTGVKPVAEAQLQAYRTHLWERCKELVQSTIVDGSRASNPAVMRCVNRLLDAISPGERIEKLRELKDKEVLIRLGEMAEGELTAKAKGGGS